MKTNEIKIWYIELSIFKMIGHITTQMEEEKKNTPMLLMGLERPNFNFIIASKSFVEFRFSVQQILA